MPLLDTPYNINAQLPILLQRVLPVCRDCVAEGEEARDAADHHFAHFVVGGGVGVDVLDLWGMVVSVRVFNVGRSRTGRRIVGLEDRRV